MIEGQISSCIRSAQLNMNIIVSLFALLFIVIPAAKADDAVLVGSDLCAGKFRAFFRLLSLNCA